MALAATPTPPTPTKPATTPTPGAQVTGQATAVSSATPVPGPPTATPTATSTRPARPITGLVLVPLSVRILFAPAGTPPDRGIISGRVLEATGRGVYGLVVKVSRSGFEQTASTGDDGGYEIADLEPGTYTVVVEQQISTPAEGVALQAGQALQVDFVQIRAASATTSATGPSPTATATATRTATPIPPTATPTPTPTATPRAAPAGMDLSRWWGWLGIELDLGGLASHLYLGIMGGFLIFAVGVIIALVRR
ncbi:MAG: carboxypeptidase-like regulatory domain-containing protein [Chloroflexota bacterium]